ncbi:MAG: ATP-binding protein [Bdellovibrionales bacterium]
MVDFSVFDSILDAAFIVDGGGKIVYCNDPGATFCQTSVRRVVGKAVLSDLLSIAEPGILPFTSESPGRLSPTPFIETEFVIAKDGRQGKLQLAVRPVDAEHWAFFIRDVSLEEALHAKYRSELRQKEDYARNLEKLVEARTAELRAVNQTLAAILNSLGQGFFTFNAEGECGNVFTRACEDILEGSPKGRKAWEVLGVSEGEQAQFRKWTEALFKELLPFEDAKGLGPSVYPHSQGRYVIIDYFPIRDEQNAISEVVVVATDKTAEHQAQQALEAERQYAAMIVKYMKNKEQFLQFIASTKQAIAGLEASAASPMDRSALAESFRVLHTLEGEAGTFSLRDLRQLARECQHVLEAFKSSESLPVEAQKRYRDSLTHMATGFREFLAANQEIFVLHEGGAVLRTVELSVDSLNMFLTELASAPGGDQLVPRYRDLFLKVPVENRLRYYDALIQAVAERLGKRVKPLRILGGDHRIFPESYSRIFSCLVHAFRNAVDHGLESPEEREWAGKDAAGLITVEVQPRSGRLSLIIRDDGKGIDPAVIRAKLKERYPERDFSSSSDEEILQHVALPGFSSRDSIGEFSGRGVGLDALREEVLSAGGSLTIKSKPGDGTSIELDLPEFNFQPAMLRSA